jgi:hypothetical protein
MHLIWQQSIHLYISSGSIGMEDYFERFWFASAALSTAGGNLIAV